MTQSKLLAIELKEYFRSPAAAFWTFAYPFVIFSLLMFAFGGSTTQAGAIPNISYGAYLICGMLTINTLSTSLFGFAIPLVEARQRGALKMFQVFPIWRFSYIIAIVFSRIIVNLMFNVAFVLIASRVFGIDLKLTIGIWINFLLLLLVVSAAFIAAGFLLASLCNRSSTATAVANVAFFPMLFFSDLFLPVSVFPPFLRVIAEFSPIGITASAFRDVMLKQASLSSQGIAIATLLVIFVVSIFISALTFRWRSN